MSEGIAFVAFWVTTLTVSVPILVVGRRHLWVFVGVLAAVSATSILVWPRSLVGGSAVLVIVPVALLVAVVGLLWRLRGFANRVDSEDVATSRLRQEHRAHRIVVRAVSEDARVMHDTLVNTLSALANGGTSLTNLTLVREQCARDVSVVEAVLAGQLSEGSRTLREKPVLPSGIRVVRTGLQTRDLEQLVHLAPTGVVVAMRGAVQELIRNAVKHSGAGVLTVDVRREPSALVVTVSDDGVGFDGPIPAGGGLAESVIARLREVDVEATVRASRGDGVVATLTIPLRRPDSVAVESSEPEPDRNDVVDRIRWAACWTWIVMVVCADAVSILVGKSAIPVAAYATVGFVAALSVLAWWVSRRGRAMPSWLSVVIFCGVSAVSIVELRGAVLGHVEIAGWVSITATPLLILLLAMGRSIRAFGYGLAAVVLTAVVSTWLLSAVIPGRALVVPQGAVIPFLILAGWLAFSNLLDRIAVQRNTDLSEQDAARVMGASQAKIAEARGRWIHAGNRRAVDILRRIADGSTDPWDPEVRLSCAQAERDLRQILMVSPEIILLSRWIGWALSDARSKSVTVNLGALVDDAADEEQAELIGRLLLGGVADVPHGAELRVGLFRSTEEATRFLMVGPRESLRRRAGAVDGEHTRISYQRLEFQDLVEVTFTGDSVDSRKRAAGRRDL
jgi:hypothetical protein